MVNLLPYQQAPGFDYAWHYDSDHAHKLDKDVETGAGSIFKGVEYDPFLSEAM